MRRPAALAATILAAALCAGCGGGSSAATSGHRTGSTTGGSTQTVPPVTTTETSPSSPVVPRSVRVRVAVPVLMYHVIAAPPPGAPFPGLYVPAPQFAQQMQALRRAGFHAVTLDQMLAFWRHGTPLPAGKPIVLTFDNGYRSQFTNALPVLERLHWVGDLNLQLSGLPPSLGGLGPPEVRALVKAGWELDSQTFSHPDLTSLSGAALTHQVGGARRRLQQLYHVPANWFCYPSGDYDAAVIAAVRAAGFAGSTTTVPGWAHATYDPYRTLRLRVLGGTTGAQLLQLLAANRTNGPPPPSAHTG